MLTVKTKRVKLLDLKKVLEKEVLSAQVSADKVRYESNKIQRETADSWSAAGDRYHASTQADIVEKKYEDVKLCLKELEKAINLSVPEKINKTCYVELIINGNIVHMLYLLKNPVTLSIPEKLVSFDSPLGKALFGKKVNQEFTYKPHKDALEIKGKIKEIG